jgi:hypothetical protein
VLAERLERAEERPLTFTLCLSTADPTRSPIERIRRQTSRASDALERTSRTLGSQHLVEPVERPLVEDVRPSPLSLFVMLLLEAGHLR